jgi:hypothetical protein
MSPRKILRLILCVVLLALLWMRIGSFPRRWQIGAVVLTLLLVIAVGLQLLNAVRKPRNLRDEVPKRPLGLE